MKKKHAFTLAEVLITLGIIGVVAAMTLPVLTAKYRISVVETYLKRFYTNMNQAVKLSVLDNGDTKYWVFPDDNDGIEEFFNKYFKKYLKIFEAKPYNGSYIIYFADGSGVQLTSLGHDWCYCLNAKDIIKYSSFDYLKKYSDGKCFRFGFYPTYGGSNPDPRYSYVRNNYYNKGIEPYVRAELTDEDGNVNITSSIKDLYNIAEMYTKLIQLNGWKIPDDYPGKI